MNKEKTLKLFNKFPEIFAGKDMSIKENLMPFGFECGDGWFWLIDELCESLQWNTDMNDYPQVVATQVKEKYGGLRFYTQGASSRQNAVISFVEKLSCSICEVCGNRGKYCSSTGNHDGWIKTLCLDCAKYGNYFEVGNET